METPPYNNSYAESASHVTMEFPWQHNMTNISHGNSTEDLRNFAFADDRIKTILLKPYSILAIVLGFLAISSNVLSLCALTQVRSSIASYFKLLMSLAISDILVGLSLVSMFLNRIVNPSFTPGYGSPADRLRSRCMFMFIKALNNTALNSTILNLMVMALDHYIAILKPLHYHLFVNNRRRYCIITGLWVVAVIFGFSDFLSGIGSYNSNERKYFNYCEHIWRGAYQEEYITLTLAVICFFTMSFIYIRIYIVVRKQQKRDQQQSCDLKKNKKALFTTLLILGSFVICWLPMCLFQLSLMIQVTVNTEHVRDNLHVFYTVEKYMQALLFLNAICDPIIYATRMREVRHGYHYLFSVCCKRYYKNRMVRRFSTQSNTLDFTLSGASMRRLSTVSRRGSLFSADSYKVTHSNSVHSSQSVPMLATVLEKDTVVDTVVPNGNGIISNGGPGIHCNGKANGSLLQKEKPSNGLRVHYDEATVGD